MIVCNFSKMFNYNISWDNNLTQNIEKFQKIDSSQLYTKNNCSNCVSINSNTMDFKQNLYTENYNNNNCLNILGNHPAIPASIKNDCSKEFQSSDSNEDHETMLRKYAYLTSNRIPIYPWFIHPK
jgi:hypothetical protein